MRRCYVYKPKDVKEYNKLRYHINYHKIKHRVVSINKVKYIVTYYKLDYNDIEMEVRMERKDKIGNYCYF